MQTIRFFFVITVLAFSAFAQTAPKVLATGAGRNFTPDDLSPDAKRAYDEPMLVVGQRRIELLTYMINDALIELEADAQKKTPEELIQATRATVPNPPAEQIQAVFDANQSVFAGKKLADVTPQIIKFLRADPEQEAVNKMVMDAVKRFPAKVLADVNGKNLPLTTVLATIGPRSISLKDFEETNKLAIYFAYADVQDALINDLESQIMYSLASLEAKKAGIDSSDYISREITGKMKDYSDEERFTLEDALKKKLFPAYNVKILMTMPKAPVQTISVAGAASRGNVGAPVTVVMFSDFQCSACAAAYPNVKKVVDENIANVRFVVKNYPLKNIHKDAQRAAQAAAAANKQGKFFELTDLFYKNQDKLDDASIKQFAASIGLNAAQFEAEMNNPATAAAIEADITEGKKLGISATPALFVNGAILRNLSEQTLRAAIAEALAGKK